MFDYWRVSISVMSQNMGCFPIWGGGNLSISQSLYTQNKDSHYGMDDHKP